MGSEMCIRDRLINTADTPLRYQLRLALLARIEAFPNSCRGIHAGVSIELVVEGAWRGHVGPACTGVKGSELCLPCTVWRAATVSEGLLSIPYSFFFVPPDGYRRNARRRTRISLEAIPSRPLRVGPCPRRPYSPHARRRGPSSGVDATQVGRRRQTFFYAGGCAGLGGLVVGGCLLRLNGCTVVFVRCLVISLLYISNLSGGFAVAGPQFCPQCCGSAAPTSTWIPFQLSSHMGTQSQFDSSRLGTESLSRER